MEKIRFGIVGIGMMGRMHATSLQRNPHAEVVAVCARTESKVKAFQEEFGTVRLHQCRRAGKQS